MSQLLRILWVEDEGGVVEAHTAALEMRGHRVELVGDASKAYEKLKAPDVCETYDRIILDIVLPPGVGEVFHRDTLDNLRGVSLLRKLADGGVSQLPPITIFSAVAIALDLEQLRAEFPYEFRAMLSKPVLVERLLEVVEA